MTGLELTFPTSLTSPPLWLPLQVQYDMLLEQFGADMSVYTRMVCDTVCITVPKAIVHCMVRQPCVGKQPSPGPSH